jgi:TolB-like protein/class 3 adenylate cyclase
VTATRRLAAILAADVVGYSRLMGEDEAGTALSVRVHREAARPIVAGFGGRIVKTTGDGLLLEFPSVVAAVECAIAIQKLMVERNAGTSEAKRIVYRIGVNLGDVLIEGDDILGDGVNIAARLEGLCEPGGVLISGTAYEHIRGRIDAEFVNSGEKDLKNIARPVRAFALASGAPSVSSSTVAACPTGPPRFSIVVLPFANLSSDPEQQYFADGVTENLTTDLSRLSGAFVISRNTAFTFKGKAVDAKQIGGELGVRYVLEGSVQRAGDRVRVNAQLIDTETGAHLWADRFQEEIADLFKLQDDVVARLANALSYELISAEAETAARSTNPDSIDLIMRGHAASFEWVRQPPTKDQIVATRSLFERALEIDPKSADALAGSALTYMLEYVYGLNDPETDYDAKVIGQADRATALARDCARAYSAKSFYLNASRRPSDALRVANAGLALNPNDALLFASRSSAETYLGLFEHAKFDAQQAIRLSPRDPRIGNWHNLTADAELGLGRFDAVIEEGSKAIDAGFRTFFSYLNLAAARALKGDMDQAKIALAEARRHNPKLSVKFLTARKPILAPAFDALRKAGLPEE